MFHRIYLSIDSPADLQSFGIYADHISSNMVKRTGWALIHNKLLLWVDCGAICSAELL